MRLKRNYVIYINIVILGLTLIFSSCKIESPYLDAIQQRINEDSGLNDGGSSDAVPPEVEITSSAGTITALSPIPFTVTFSEPVIGFEQGDIVVTVDTGSYSITDFKPNADDTEYNLSIGPTSDPANVTVMVDANVATDAAGNNNNSAVQACSVIYDTSVLAVDAITADITSPTKSSQVQLTITFSEEVSGFTESDIVIGKAWEIDQFNDLNNPIFIVDVQAGNEGEVTVDIPAGAATSAAKGVENVAAQQFSFIYDVTAPGNPNVTGADTTIDTTPRWDWTSGGEGNGIFRYKLNDNDLSTGTMETTDTFYIKDSPPLSEGTHTLYVQERDEAGNWSSSGSKAIVIDIIAPSNPSPADGETSTGIKPVLDWEDILEAEAYYIQINTQSGFGDGTMVVEDTGVTESSYQVTNNLIHGNTYYWRLKTVNEDGFLSPWSGIWNFTAQYTIGDLGPAGGVIFYDDEADEVDDISGIRFLEAAPASRDWVDVEWGAYEENVPGADGVELGTGWQNTIDLIAHLGTGDTYAAQLCDGLDEGGYGDWFLPSKDEVDLMYLNLKDIGSAGIENDHYWSSSEYDQYDAYTRSWAPSNNHPKNLGVDHRVRAIRAF